MQVNSKYTLAKLEDVMGELWVYVINAHRQRKLVRAFLAHLCSQEHREGRHIGRG